MIPSPELDLNSTRERVWEPVTEKWRMPQVCLNTKADPSEDLATKGMLNRGFFPVVPWIP